MQNKELTEKQKEFIAKIAEQNVIIEMAKKSIRIMSEKYIEENAEFKEGEKVLIKNLLKNKGDRFAFVRGLCVNVYTGEIWYKLLRCNKDGSKSKIKDNYSMIVDKLFKIPQ